jgi:hypothetical protein
MRRTRTKALAALTTMAVVLAGGVAWADELRADGDGLTPVSVTTPGNDVAFGNVCPGTTVTKTVLLALERTTSGNPNIFRCNRRRTGLRCRVRAAPGSRRPPRSSAAPT